MLPKGNIFILVETTGLDGLCPSFATRTPDYVRLRRGRFEPLFYCFNNKRKKPPNGDFPFMVETTGLEPVTPCTSSKCSSQLSYASKALLL